MPRRPETKKCTIHDTTPEIRNRGSNQRRRRKFGFEADALTIAPRKRPLNGRFAHPDIYYHILRVVRVARIGGRQATVLDTSRTVSRSCLAARVRSGAPGNLRRVGDSWACASRECVASQPRRRRTSEERGAPLSGGFPSCVSSSTGFGRRARGQRVRSREGSTFKARHSHRLLGP